MALYRARLIDWDWKVLERVEYDTVVINEKELVYLGISTEACFLGGGRKVYGRFRYKYGRYDMEMYDESGLSIDMYKNFQGGRTQNRKLSCFTFMKPVVARRFFPREESQGTKAFMAVFLDAQETHNREETVDFLEIVHRHLAYPRGMAVLRRNDYRILALNPGAIGPQHVNGTGRAA